MNNEKREEDGGKSEKQNYEHQSKGSRVGDIPATRAEFSLQPMGMTTVKQITITKPGEDHAGAAGTLSEGSMSHRKYMWEKGKRVRGRRC